MDLAYCAPSLPPSFYISQNPAKDQALAAFPPVAAMRFSSFLGGSDSNVLKCSMAHKKILKVLVLYEFEFLKIATTYGIIQ